MKHQSMRDRADERHGMEHHMKRQSHMDRMHEREGMEHSMHHSRSESHGIYRNEVEKPSMPMEGHMEKGWGCHEFKNEADPIAIGQSGEAGMRSDEGKMHSQFKHYGWD